MGEVVVLVVLKIGGSLIHFYTSPPLSFVFSSPFSILGPYMVQAPEKHNLDE